VNAGDNIVMGAITVGVAFYGYYVGFKEGEKKTLAEIGKQARRRGFWNDAECLAKQAVAFEYSADELEAERVRD
jgi:hypothetical protein